MKKKIYIDSMQPEDIGYLEEVFAEIGIDKILCDIKNSCVLVETDLDDDEIDDAIFDAGLDCEGISACTSEDE